MWNCFAIVVEWTQNNSELGLRHRKLEGNMDRVGGSNKPDVGLRMYSVTEIFFLAFNFNAVGGNMLH